MEVCRSLMQARSYFSWIFTCCGLIIGLAVRASCRDGPFDFATVDPSNFEFLGVAFEISESLTG